MPSIQGSSRILNTSGINGLTGPAGALGPTGSTGATGATGATGPIGFIGTGIFSGSTGASGWTAGTYGHDLIVFYLTDGTTLGISGARGATGDALSQNYTITNAVENPEYGKIFNIKNGVTAYFKSLTVSGEDISIGATSDYTILLRGITQEQGRVGNTGELVYNFSGASAQGVLNTHWSGDELTARILQFRESSGSNTLLQNPENTSTIAGTADKDGTAVIFEYLIDVDGLTATSSGIHLGQTGNSDGSSADVLYRFAGVTHGVTYDVGSRICSCCFCKNDGTYSSNSSCVDYVSENYCTEIGGVFSLNSCFTRPEGPDCYVEGACCVNGVCVHTSKTKCEDTYGGFFAVNLTCEEVNELGEGTDTDFDNGCPLPCFERGACCINNFCYEYTEYECSFFPDSTWINQPCDEVNCCLQSQTGACCLDEVCYETTPLLCPLLASSNGSPGMFWGIGSSCAGPFRNTGVYAPHDCGFNEDGSAIGPISSDGVTCQDGTVPPCFGCLGWVQVIVEDCPDNICACDGIGYCDSDYEENVTGEAQCCACSCGTCSSINVSDCIGACCVERTDGTRECSQLNVDNCNLLVNDPQYTGGCWGGCETQCELPNGDSRCDSPISCCNAKTDIMMLVDASQSMSGSRMNKAKEAMRNLVSTANASRDKIGLVSYNADANLDSGLTSNYNQLITAIDSITIAGQNFMSLALIEAREEFERNARYDNAEQIIILLADGDTKDEDVDATLAEAEVLKELGVQIYTIRFCEEDGNEEDNCFDPTLLQTIASGVDYYYDTIGNLDLTSIYLQIYADLCEDSEYGGGGVAEVVQSCGSIILADGTCWECCCASDIPDGGNFGYCCTNQECIGNVLESDCVGSWYETEEECTSNCTGLINGGACCHCIDNINYCSDNIPSTYCINVLNGHYFGDFTTCADNYYSCGPHFGGIDTCEDECPTLYCFMSNDDPLNNPFGEDCARCVQKLVDCETGTFSFNDAAPCIASVDDIATKPGVSAGIWPAQLGGDNPFSPTSRCSCLGRPMEYSGWGWFVGEDFNSQFMPSVLPCHLEQGTPRCGCCEDKRPRCACTRDEFGSGCIDRLCYWGDVPFEDDEDGIVGSWQCIERNNEYDSNFCCEEYGLNCREACEGDCVFVPTYYGGGGQEGDPCMLDIQCASGTCDCSVGDVGCQFDPIQQSCNMAYCGKCT